MRRIATPTLSLLAALLVLVAMPASTGAAGGGGRQLLRGTVPAPGLNVALMAARPGGGNPLLLGRARSGRGGAFTIAYRRPGPRSVAYLLATRPGGGAEAGYPVPGGSYRLAAALGAGQLPQRVTVDERTTVAIGFAMAQFIGGGRVGGKDPGLRNAAAMSADLVDLHGGLSRVLRRFPNGGSTATLPTFDSLANLLAACRRQNQRCARLLRAAGAPGAGPATDTLAAAVNIARYPWHDAAALFGLLLRSPRLYAPALVAGERPDAWTLALRFESNPPALDGPGNFAIDAGGNLWVANNYAYSRRSRQPACGSEELFRFKPNGADYPGSPYSGGGLSGVGFGVTIDPSHHVWTGNFGFEGKGCEIAAPHNSLSEFNLAGEALSPDFEPTEIESPPGSGRRETVQRGGWEVGDAFWPQATVSDREGNIWAANCGNDSVTRVPGGDAEAAVNLPATTIAADGAAGFARPFGIAVGTEGHVFVSANESATVAELGPHGEPLRLIGGGGLHRPLGIASDSKGNVWVSNSTWVVAPCVGEFHQQGGPGGGGTVTLIESDGELAPHDPISGAGLVNPWGIAVDGNDQVWVANFGGRRLSELCGSTPANCPAGKRRTGAAISPSSGYGFDGLVRNTGVAIDPSGNVWLANNWKQAAIQTNPGGYQIVAYLGLAAPVKAPLLGPPQRP